MFKYREASPFESTKAVVLSSPSTGSDLPCNPNATIIQYLHGANGIAVLAWSMDLKMAWDSAIVLASVSHLWERKTKALQITARKVLELTCMDCGLYINLTWNPLNTTASPPPVITS